MKKYIKLAKRYKFFLAFMALNLLLLFTSPDIGRASFQITQANLAEMLSILPAIFVLLGLMDVWIERETMIKYMGENAGLKGGVIAFIMGSAAAGPLYAAFPIAGMLLKKGAKLSNIFIFIGAWSTTKIPMILFETSNLGWKFMLVRLICSVIGIIIIAIILEKTTSAAEKAELYEKSRTMV